MWELLFIPVAILGAYLIGAGEFDNNIHDVYRRQFYALVLGVVGVFAFLALPWLGIFFFSASAFFSAGAANSAKAKRLQAERFSGRKQ